MDIQDLISSDVRRRGTAEPAGLCLDALIDVAEGHVAYFLLEVSGDAGPVPALIAPKHVIWSDQALVLDISEADLATATEKGAPPEAQPVDLTALPPLLIGPFGNTVAPAMFGALYNSIAGRNRTPRPNVDAQHAAWHWFEDLQGRPVFDERGDVGSLRSLTLDAQGRQCTHLVVAPKQGEDLTIPFSALRNVSRTEQNLILDRTDPPPHSIARLEEEIEKPS